MVGVWSGSVGWVELGLEVRIWFGAMVGVWLGSGSLMVVFLGSLLGCPVGVTVGLVLQGTTGFCNGKNYLKTIISVR